MDNSLNQFSLTVFAIQMVVLFSVVYGVYLFLKYKKRKVDEALKDDFNESANA